MIVITIINFLLVLFGGFNMAYAIHALSKRQWVEAIGSLAASVFSFAMAAY